MTLNAGGLKPLRTEFHLTGGHRSDAVGRTDAALRGRKAWNGSGDHTGQSETISTQEHYG